MKVCKRCVVSGRVQGVFFRQGTADQAQSLGVQGWVRNLATGEVECLICGEEKAVEALCQWLHRGPDTAHVESVQIEDADWEDHDGFRIMR